MTTKKNFHIDKLVVHAKLGANLHVVVEQLLEHMNEHDIDLAVLEFNYTELRVRKENSVESVVLDYYAQR